MSRETRISIVTLSGGQPRRYADSRYEYEITLEWDTLTNEPGPYKPTGTNLLTRAEKLVIAQHHQIARTVADKADGKWQWYEAYVAELREVEPGKAYVKIVEPYLD